jgi:beta-lactamase class A
VIRIASITFAALLIAVAAPSAAADDLPQSSFGTAQPVLDDILASLDLERPIDDGRLAVALVILDGYEAESLAMVNGHQMLYAASLPKIAILYGAAVAIDRDRLELTDALEADMVAMIRSSCNSCATRVLEQVGREWLLELLQSDPYRFYDRGAGGGLWVGKDYARAGAFQREPLEGLSHAATPWQVARWYYLLVNGKLASEEQTSLMLECLSDPAISHKFVRGLTGRETSELYRKSGTWRQYHADSVLVSAETASYILVALAADERGGRWLAQIARRVHDRLATGAGTSRVD